MTPKLADCDYLLLNKVISDQNGHPWELGKSLIEFTKKSKIQNIKYKSDIEYFYRNLIFGLSDCWYWNGSICNLGYGLWSRKGLKGKAHRAVFKLFYNFIPSDCLVLHKCDSRNCVNPDHLFIGTQLDNIKDMIAKKRNVNPKPKFGADNPMAKLNLDLIKEAKKLRSKNMSYRQIGEKLGFSTMAIFRALTGRSWKHDNK